MNEQEQEKAREQVARMLRDQFPRSTAVDAEFGANTLIALLPTVLRAAGDDAVAEALEKAGWKVVPIRRKVDGVFVTQWVAKSEWRPVTPEVEA